MIQSPMLHPPLKHDKIIQTYGFQLQKCRQDLWIWIPTRRVLRVDRRQIISKRKEGVSREDSETIIEIQRI